VDAVLYYIYEPLSLNGSHINALEYYLTIWQYNPDIHLVLVNAHESTKLELIKIANNRYDLSDLTGWEKNIKCVKDRIKLIKQNFGTVLVLDFYTIPNTRDLFHCHYLVEIAEFTRPEHAPPSKPFSRYDKHNSREHIIYGEMPWQDVDKKYRMKFMFDRFKTLKLVTPGYYINSPGNPTKGFIKKLNLEHKPIIYKSRTHLDNMFEYFDEYIYYHCGAWFDPHPRLFVESTFYGKKIQYYNKKNIKDGSYYRYKDVCKNGIAGRILNKNDEVVKHFI
jgi:hypothetical protein